MSEDDRDGHDERSPDDGPLGFGSPPSRDAPDPDRYAHRRDPDLAAYGIGPDAVGEVQRQPRAQLPAGSSRYTWFIGVVAVLVIAYVSVNTITSQGPGSRGVAPGALAPPFAAPLATGNLTGDVNVARRSDQGNAGQVPACSIHRPDVLTICDLYARKPVVLAFFATRGSACSRELDTLERLSRSRTDVAYAAIAIRGSRGDVRKQIRAGGWSFPVGYDHDGVLANLYSVAICPQVAFIRRGGRIAGTTFGEVGERELRARITALAAGRALPADG
ncbi:MAG: hypothetical protein JWM31_2354 [Solirubrobacterales bacterium]|nr:hypothetical protein [Solirubrobacterales bacterium]